MTTYEAPNNRRSAHIGAAHRVDAGELRSVQAVTDALERVRRVCSEVGLATLLAEVREVPTEEVCAALNSLAVVGESVIATLQSSIGGLER